MSDNGVKSRVKELLGMPMASEQSATMDHSPAAAQQQALQVLTLAQRTADQHLASAHGEAERIVGDARGTAAQILRDAQARAEVLQQEAKQVRSGAQAEAARIAADAEATTEAAQREAEETMSVARARADEIAKDAQAKADELQQLAQQRHDDVVGGLAGRREALQRQIEALERFDREYRSRLQAFMQTQLRALWVDEPTVTTGSLEEPDLAPPVEPVPAQRDDAEEPTGRTGRGSRAARKTVPN